MVDSLVAKDADWQAIDQEQANWQFFFDYFIQRDEKYFPRRIIIPQSMGPVRIKSKEEKMIEAVQESCVFKSVLSCTLGKRSEIDCLLILIR